MKTKIALASAFIAASSFSTAEIVINDFLSFEGFVDMSYYTADTELDAGGSESDNSFQVDQVEISWLFDFDPVTAQIDLQYLGGGYSRGDVEQAFVTYHFDNGSAVTAGLYASMLGFEAFEPTGLYQYSFAYDVGVLLPDYAQGVKYTYESESSFFGLSFQDTGVTGSYRNRFGGDGDIDLTAPDGGGFGVEAAYGYYMDNGLSFFLGAAVEDGDDGDAYVVNSYVTYETGAWIFAAELNYGEQDGSIYDTYTVTADESDVFSGLLMANFAYSDAASVTGRVSFIDGSEDDTTGASTDTSFVKYTLAHGYAFTDNLFLVTEVSYADGEIVGVDGDTLSAAVELIFSF